MIILFSLGLTVAASAQHYGHRVYVRPRVVVGVGAYAPFAPYWGYGYYPWGVPYGSYYSARSSRLEMKVQDIKADYKDRIWSARHDKTLSRAQRKQEVHQLKHERDEAIIQARRNYYKTRPAY